MRHVIANVQTGDIDEDEVEDMMKEADKDGARARIAAQRTLPFRPEMG